MMFLIRTKENRISGPFPKEVILERMQSGDLHEMDEVCPASGYWIYLHEREESMKLLGVALARTEDFHEESTETDTETVTATAPYAANTAKDMMHEGNGPETYSAPTAPAIPPVTTGNRPEVIRALKFVLWIFVFLLAFILLRVYRVANPF